MKRLSRKSKKILRKIFLCYTGNTRERKSKYSKEKWIIFRKQFDTWFKGTIKHNKIQEESKIANSIKNKK